MKTLFLIFSISLTVTVSVKGQEAEPADSLTHQLREALVTARQPATKLVGSAFVSTIAGSSLQYAGNALDVLRQLPMLQVQDGEVSVVGRNNLSIFIDGRPLHDKEELRQLLSGNVRKVELQMVPGPMYDSTTGAVLKITTRRTMSEGLSFTEQLQVQRRRRWSMSDLLDAGYRARGWDFFLSGSFNCNNTLMKGTTLNSLAPGGTSLQVGSLQHSLNEAKAGTVKAGFNYAKKSESLGAYYRYAPERGDFTNIGAEWMNREIPVPTRIMRDISGYSHLASAYYDNIFSGGYQLHFDGNFRRSSVGNAVCTAYPSSEYSEVCSTDRKMSVFWAAKLWLKFPFAKGELTCGTQDSHTSTSLDYRMLDDRVGTYIPSSLTETCQTSAALFAVWSRRFGKISLSAGARYEYADHELRIDGKRDKEVSRRDHLLTPDLSFSYDFGQRSRVSLSYKMSTVRPPYAQLSGSMYYAGQHLIEGGNPGLRDERRHDVQLFGTWKDVILQAAFVRSLDTYAFIRQVHPAPSLQLLMRPVNIDVSSFSMYLVWQRKIRCWTPSLTAGLYKQWLVAAGNDCGRPICSYTFGNTFSLPREWLITANIGGSSRGYMHTNCFSATAFEMDASVGRTFLDKSLTVKLSATDIFNTSRNDWSMNTCGIRVDKYVSYDRRGVSLDVIYRFRPRQNSYKGKAAAETEMNRL